MNRNDRLLVEVTVVGKDRKGVVADVTNFIFKNDGNKINDQYKYLVKINPRGKASISDHYFFTEKGVPAFFFYTLGGIKAYHDVFDKSSTLPLNEQADLFSLLVKFNAALTGN